jgi:hypothetical protein
MVRLLKINGKVVGELSGDRYITQRNSTRHFYRKRQGYPISVEILTYLRNNNIKYIEIHETRQSGKVFRYRCFTSDYDFVEPFQEQGFDMQKCIPLRRMESLDNGE